MMEGLEHLEGKTLRTAEDHYWAIHGEIKSLHRQKGEDYGSDDDPFANLRVAAEVGLKPWRGVVLRILDKIQRLKSYCKKGVMSNESVEDTFLDLANYAMLGLALFREEKTDDQDQARGGGGPQEARTDGGPVQEPVRSGGGGEAPTW